jgi:uncharacterized protein (TIGR02147 family)
MPRPPRQDNPIVRRLKEVLAEKSEKNPGYSLRALARSLKVPAATLSRILAGKRGISLEMATRIAQGLTPLASEQRRLLRAYALEPQKAPAQATRYRYLELRELEQLNHWGYGALLEVLRGEHGIRSQATLAQATGLTEQETDQCLKNLMALKLVHFTVKRGWYTRGQHLSSIRWEGSEPWKDIHKGYAAQAVRYFERFDPKEASIQGITFLAPPGRIDEAKQRIREFAEELSDDLSASEGAPILHRLNVQLFPLGRKG